MPVIASHITPRCRQCGSELVFVKKVTEQIEDYKSKVTTTIYRCSNESCQADIEKKTALRLKTQKDQELAKLRRLQAQGKKKE